MITLAEQDGNYIHVYNEKGNLMFSLMGMLHGYTAYSVAIKNGNVTYVYDEHNLLLFSK